MGASRDINAPQNIFIDATEIYELRTRYKRDKRDINELVLKVVFKNRCFSICRDLVVIERRVSTVIVVVIMIVTTVMDIHTYTFIYI